MAEEEARGRCTAAELLGNWRAAERDVIAAQDTNHSASEQALEGATRAERDAGEAYHAAERQGFPKD